MELHTLKPAKGSVKKNHRRLGRGQGSGRGGTATKGHKGYKSRAGAMNKRSYEGGQTPLQMRVPKRGFNNFSRVEYIPLNLKVIEEIISKYKVDKIDLEFLRENNIIRKTDLVKILATGNLESKVNVEANACSAKAKEAIEAKGGVITIV
jgi:large subunit ribosomal protein L15